MCINMHGEHITRYTIVNSILGEFSFLRKLPRHSTPLESSSILWWKSSAYKGVKLTNVIGPDGNNH